MAWPISLTVVSRPRRVPSFWMDRSCSPHRRASARGRAWLTCGVPRGRVSSGGHDHRRGSRRGRFGGPPPDAAAPSLAERSVRAVRGSKTVIFVGDGWSQGRVRTMSRGHSCRSDRPYAAPSGTPMGAKYPSPSCRGRSRERHDDPHYPRREPVMRSTTRVSRPSTVTRTTTPIAMSERAKSHEARSARRRSGSPRSDDGGRWSGPRRGRRPGTNPERASPRVPGGPSSRPVTVNALDDQPRRPGPHSSTTRATSPRRPWPAPQRAARSRPAHHAGARPPAPASPRPAPAG